MTAKGISPIRGRSLQSERSNDFSPDTAIAEVIDNSIEASAKNIKLRIHSETPRGKQKPRPYTIAFGDDGSGMDEKILQECLVLGESTRFNSRKGIGRFGVGMTKGAISVCNKIEVYSRPYQGNWNYVKLDLKELDENGDPYVTLITPKPLPSEFKDLVGDCGTLVIWSDIDRIESDFSINKLKHWLGRTYRKFIGEKIIENGKIIENKNKISLTIDSEDGNGNQEVKSFDPLYVIPDPKKPNELTAKLLDDWTETFPVSPIDALEGDPPTGKITIRMSFTPEEWRPIEKISGHSTENIARHIPDNEGISILRKNREVAYKHVPNWSPVFTDIDRFWSCEIDFEPLLDFHFKVNNIKVGASPLYDVREFLQEQINPTRKKLVAKVRELWAINKSKSISGEKLGGDHKKGETNEGGVIKHKPLKPLTPEEKKKQQEALKRKKISEQEAREILARIQDPKAPPIILYDTMMPLSDANFIEIEPIGNKTVVWLNTNHQFFQNLYDKIKNLGEPPNGENIDKEELVNIASDLKTDIDNMIIAFTDSYNDLTKSDVNENVSVILEKLLMNWSFCLRRLYRNSPNG